MNKEDLQFYLPKSFKGLSQQYILDCIFNDVIQSKWKPQIGDVIVGKTGNIFVISNDHELVDELGGKIFFFGGGMCNRDRDSSIMNETYSMTMNESGRYYIYGKNGIEEQQNFYHSSWKEFKFIPYPHEKDRM